MEDEEIASKFKITQDRIPAMVLKKVMVKITITCHFPGTVLRIYL